MNECEIEFFSVNFDLKRWVICVFDENLNEILEFYIDSETFQFEVEEEDSELYIQILPNLLKWLELEMKFDTETKTKLKNAAIAAI